MTLPDGVKPYGKSPTFTAETVPAKLLSAHDLKPKTWGRLNVIAGDVTYYLEGASQPLITIKAGQIHTIPPEERHYISVSEGAEFYIEFCAAAKEIAKTPHTSQYASPPCSAPEVDPPIKK